MSRKGLEVALRHGEALPAFAGQVEAEKTLFRHRDSALALLTEVAGRLPHLSVDATPDTLKHLEQCYFSLNETDGFGAVGCTREEFEACMAMQFGEIAVRSAAARWVVQEFAFAPGRYQLGVEKGNVTFILGGQFANHYAAPNNKRRQALFRTYKRYFR